MKIERVYFPLLLILLLILLSSHSIVVYPSSPSALPLGMRKKTEVLALYRRYSARCPHFLSARSSWRLTPEILLSWSQIQTGEKSMTLWFRGGETERERERERDRERERERDCVSEMRDLANPHYRAVDWCERSLSTRGNRCWRR